MYGVMDKNFENRRIFETNRMFQRSNLIIETLSSMVPRYASLTWHAPGAVPLTVVYQNHSDCATQPKDQRDLLACGSLLCVFGQPRLALKQAEHVTTSKTKSSATRHTSQDGFFGHSIPVHTKGKAVKLHRRRI